MALKVADTQTRLRQDIAERQRAAEALRVSEASYRAIFDAAEDAIFVHDIDTGAIVDVNLKACATFGYTREEFQRNDIGTLGTGERPYTPAGCDGAAGARACRRRRCASNGTAGARTAVCAGTRCSSSA